MTRPEHPSIASTRYLDGLRGCAALYVAVNHLADHYVQRARALRSDAAWLDWAHFLTFGRFGVAIFIVLSGFLLARTVVERPDLALTGGIRPFLVRRARRILPPYYAALFVSLAAIAVIPSLASRTTPMWDSALPVGLGDILSHLLLVHNLQEAWIYKINPPLWSVATEAQIYLFFPFVLLPLWRSLDFRVATMIGVLIGVAPTWIAGGSPILSSPWFLSLFVMGMAAARITFSPEAMCRRWRRFAWAESALVATSVLLLLCATVWRPEKPWMTSELLVGLWLSTALIACTRARIANKGLCIPIVRLLETPALLKLGAFSYSLYLIHQPILSVVAGALHLPSPGLQLAVTSCVGIPLCIVMAYGFHCLFERPFMSGWRERHAAGGHRPAA